MEKVIIFDTLAYIKKMKEAGFTNKQAEVQAESLRGLLEDQIATKRDLRDLEKGIVIRLGAMIAASIAITVTLIKVI